MKVAKRGTCNQSLRSNQSVLMRDYCPVACNVCRVCRTKFYPKVALSNQSRSDNTWCSQGIMATNYSGKAASSICCAAECGTCNRIDCSFKLANPMRSRALCCPQNILYNRAGATPETGFQGRYCRDFKDVGCLVRLPGVNMDIARRYTAANVNASARLWRRDAISSERLRRQHAYARKECGVLGGADGKTANWKDEKVLPTGGFCLSSAASATVRLPNNQSFQLPPLYLLPDARILSFLLGILRKGVVFGEPLPAREELKRIRARPQTILDVAAGVGAYGHSLFSLDPTLQARRQWRGHDGAGNIEEVTAGFVRFSDLTLPDLALPKADWVVALEVAEHVPNMHEEQLVRNLHAHACRGVILSWAILGQAGTSHVNNHDKACECVASALTACCCLAFCCLLGRG